MRTLFAVLLLTPTLTLADTQPSSPLNEARLFNTVESYHLDPGSYRIELQGSSGQPETQPAMELRAQIGITDHIQVGVAQDLTEARDHAPVLAAAPITLRYSLGRMEDEVLGNPSVEAQFTPRANAPARAGLKLLLSESVLPHVVLAVNGYFEQNVDRGTSSGADGAFGARGGVSYALLPGLLHLGGEAQLGEAQYGLPDYYLVAAMGPNAVLRRGPFALTVSVMANLAPVHVGLEPAVTLGATF